MAAKLLEEGKALISHGKKKDETAAASSSAAAVAPEAKKDPEKTRSKTDFARATEYLQQLKDLPDDHPVKKGLKCFCKWGVKPLIIIVMAYIWLGKQLYKVYKLLPTNLLNIVFGVGLCFFGGSYFAAIAAAEAALNLGGADMWANLQTVYEEASGVADASRKDDEVDADKDGTADVQQMGMNELINHKAKIAMVAVKDPMKLQQAMVSLGNVWVAVIATLKFQFAKTVAIALGIANMLSLPACRLVGPMLCMVMGPELNHWVPAIVDTTVKFIAVGFASYLQSIISAFYSGLRGGKMVAEGLFNIMGEYGIMDKLPDRLVTKPFDADNSYLDECIQYPLAAFGFYWQITSGFALTFPLNLICLPLTIIEYIIRWQVFT